MDKAIRIVLPEDLKNRLKAIAAKQGRFLYEIFLEALEEKANKEEGKKCK